VVRSNKRDPRVNLCVTAPFHDVFAIVAYACASEGIVDHHHASSGASASRVYADELKAGHMRRGHISLLLIRHDTARTVSTD